jgi:hypothetical protein
MGSNCAKMNPNPEDECSNREKMSAKYKIERAKQ